MRRRLMLKSRAGVSPVLPAEYQQVEWVGNPIGRESVIDTLYTPVYGDVIETEFVLYNSHTYHSILSAGTENYQLVLLLSGTSATNANYFKNFSSGSATSIGNAPSNGVGKIKCIINTAPASDQLQLQWAGGSTIATNTYMAPIDGNNTHLHIFARTNLTSFLEGAYFNFNITNSGKLKLNLIPCYKKSNGEIGFFDSVSRRFLTNSGTGSFTKGADI